MPIIIVISLDPKLCTLTALYYFHIFQHIFLGFEQVAGSFLQFVSQDDPHEQLLRLLQKMPPVPLSKYQYLCAHIQILI